MSALFIAIVPLHVQWSKHTRMDVLMPFLLLLALYYCIKIVREKGIFNYAIASFLTGLAIATKYPAVVFTLTIITAYIISKGWQYRAYLKPTVSIIACIAGVFFGSPFLFLDFQQVLLDVAGENRTQHLSHTGEGLIKNLIWYFQHTLPESFTYYGLLLIGIGFVLCLTSKQKDKWLLISFPLFFLLFISSLNLRFDRWLVPIIPFGCILLAYGICEFSKLVEYVFKLPMRFWIFFISLGIVSTSLLSTSIIQGREMSGIDTRALARQWIINNIPSGSSLLVERYTPQLPKKSFKFFQASNDKENEGALIEIDPYKIRHAIFRPTGGIGEIRDVEDIKRKKIEYMVMSSLYDRYLAEQERYPRIVANYEKIMSSGSLIHEETKIPKVNMGDRIRIYKLGKPRAE